ncbi:hypothetical protein HBO34_15400 [Pseudomonas veronii]|uniref:hypothetical protein n=1 Tax=Pseudomonas veronii TaxID=76761 RepID=UPI0014767359|nr:hypothetical protein [Pseudomonas veronii]NMX39259.1 hypothetical protein [Pseudomonas veronii]
MSRITQIGWRRVGLGLIAIVLFLGLAIRLGTDEPEIALTPGEPWEDMRQRSSAKIGPAIPGHHWFRAPKSDARLRLVDPQYGFITPLARFFTIGFDDEQIDGIRMSPQIEPLLLDDTLEIVLDLQEQWRKGGWTPIHIKDDPPFADTPQWRARLRNVNLGGTSYWQAADKYQVMMVVNRFKDVRHPTEERYLIKLHLAAPWIPQ